VEQWKSSIASLLGTSGTSSGQSTVFDANLARTKLDDFKGIFSSFANNVTKHMDLEEQSYWPKMQPVMTQEEQRTLYENLVRAKASGPTRTHPSSSAPSGPLGAKIMHPVSGVIDRALDAVQGRQG
jgi:hypothetical protein